MSEKDAKVWLKAEYGPDRLVPCKWKHSGQQDPGFTREVRTQAACLSIGRRNFLIIGYATSPQTGMCGGLVIVTWQLGLPPEKPKPRPFISNGVTGDRACSAKEINHIPRVPSSLLPCQ